MYGRSFGTANGDYIVPEKYGGTVYRRPSERTDPPKEEPRVTPVSGGIHLSQKAAEMHDQDIRRITGEASDAQQEKTSPESAVREEEKPSDAAAEKQTKRRFPDVSEEELLLIGLMILMLGGQRSSRVADDGAGEAQTVVTPHAAEQDRAADPAPDDKSDGEDDILIPLLLALLIW